MTRRKAFATKLPADLIHRLDEACEKLGLRKNHVVESALAERLEDLFDAYDLREAIQQATGFHSWKSVQSELKRKKHS